MNYKTFTMEWIYKNIRISINTEGKFFFNMRGKDFFTISLNKAKEIIDEELSLYYVFTQEDMNKLLSKLDDREKSLIKSLYQEIEKHIDNPYCQLGICDEDWKWEWDFNK